MIEADALAEHGMGLPLRQKQIDWLIGQGVYPLWLARTYHGQFGFANFDKVVFASERFEFERHTSTEGGQGAFTFLLFDEDGEPADILAWREPQAALWLGRVACLGEEQVLRPRLGEPLLVHRTVLDWLRAGRRGIIVVDHARAARVLQNEVLGVLDAAHARQLRAGLTIATPPVVVVRGVEEAA